MRVEDFIQTEHQDGITTFWLDHKLASQNIVSPEIIEILDRVFADFEADPEARAGIIISRKDNFIAGADIKSFAIEKKGDFRPAQEKGHASLGRLSTSKKPVVAAIHGACMGLGTELALACHARIAAREPSTKFALPEVRLGLLPGGGGTQRLPRLVGIQRALDMMLTGKNIYAYQAKKMGLVDELTDRQKLHQAATMLAHQMLKKTHVRKSKMSLFNRLLEDTGLGRSILFQQARKRAYKQSQGNYPAVPAILDCVEVGYKNGVKAGYEKELELFEELMLTPESAAMRHLFFAMTANKKARTPDEAHPVSKLAVIGGGFMGSGIAEVSVNNGYDVLLKDINTGVLTSARKQVWKGIAKKLKYRSVTKVEAEQMMGRLQGQLTYDNFEHVDLVVEAVLEKMDLKKKIIDDIQAHCKPEVIIASNTSSLSIAEMASYADKPAQVIGMHYFSPVPKMPLLEIVKTPQTAPWVIDACYALGVAQGKTCIVVNDSPGFYVNRILAPYMNEALLLLDEGVGMLAIDKAMKKLGFPVGPITLFDQVGLDIAAHVVHSSEKIVEGREGFEISKSVVNMFEAGRLGKKNRKGFYRYDAKSGKRAEPDETAYQFFKGNGTRKMERTQIQQRLLMLMLNEAVLCLEDNVIESPGDGDLGAVFGIGFLPFTAGPFKYIDKLGAEHVVKTMDALADRYGPKFAPAETLRKHFHAGTKFYPLESV